MAWNNPVTTLTGPNWRALIKQKIEIALITPEVILIFVLCFAEVKIRLR